MTGDDRMPPFSLFPIDAYTMRDQFSGIIGIFCFSMCHTSIISKN